MKTYGLPYKGSKDKICEKICSLFPIKENFYDLFMGGASITHYQLLQNQYKNYYANDFNPLVVKAFDMAIHGKFRNETRWISHEEFDKLKNIDPYVAFCFSFGNDLKSYAYGKDVEPYKKALHYAIVFQEYELLNEIFNNIDFTFLDNIDNKNERRLRLRQFMKRNNLGHNTPLENVERLNSLNRFAMDDSSLNRLPTNEHLQSLLQLESVQRLEIFSASYDEIKIKPNSIIYVDPPYKGTNKYSISADFDYEKFYSWCEKQTELCFISEYDMPQDRFECIAEIEHRSTINANENQSVIERVFLPKHQVKNYKAPSLFDMM